MLPYTADQRLIQNCKSMKPNGDMRRSSNTRSQIERYYSIKRTLFAKVQTLSFSKIIFSIKKTNFDQIVNKLKAFDGDKCRLQNKVKMTKRTKGEKSDEIDEETLMFKSLEEFIRCMFEDSQMKKV